MFKRAWATEAATTTFIPAVLRNIWSEPEYTCALYRSTRGVLIKRLQTVKYRSPKPDQFQARFQVFTILLLKIPVFSDVKLCRCVSGSPGSEGSQFLHLQSYNDCLTPEQGNTKLRKVGNCSPSNDVSNIRIRYLQKSSVFIPVSRTS